MTAGCRVTWWGHATTTIEVDGVRLLTDPVLTLRIAHLARIHGAAPGGAALNADAVLISHLHHDHLHVPSLRTLDPGVRIIAPTGAADLLRRKLSRHVEEVGPGDAVEVAGVHVLAVPAAHDGRRSPLSRHRGPALGYVVSTAGGRIWFAGDTGLFPELADVGPVDVAIVPVGGWGPTLGDTHLDPQQAAEAVRRLDAQDAIPIHYGTFWPIGLRHLSPAGFARHFTDPGERFVEEMAAACPGVRVHVLARNTTVSLSGESDE